MCGEWNDGIWEVVTEAHCESVDRNAIPDGKLIVRAAAMPFGVASTAIEGLNSTFAPLYGMTVAYECGGLVEAFQGLVKVSIPTNVEMPFSLVCLNNEKAAMWTDIPFQLEDGMLSFETDKASLYLLLPVD